MPDPISDLTPFVRHLDHCVVWKPGALRCNCGLADAFDALSAALASPEGVVTLDGKQWLLESVEAMLDGHAEWLYRLVSHHPEDPGGSDES